MDNHPTAITVNTEDRNLGHIITELSSDSPILQRIPKIYETSNGFSKRKISVLDLFGDYWIKARDYKLSDLEIRDTKKLESIFTVNSYAAGVLGSSGKSRGKNTKVGFYINQSSFNIVMLMNLLADNKKLENIHPKYRNYGYSNVI